MTIYRERFHRETGFSVSQFTPIGALVPVLFPVPDPFPVSGFPDFPYAHDKVLDNNLDQIGIWKCWFLKRGENRSTRRKTSWSRVENQQQTQPTYDAGSRNRTRDTLVGGECSHHCANPAPLPWFYIPFFVAPNCLNASTLVCLQSSLPYMYMLSINILID